MLIVFSVVQAQLREVRTEKKKNHVSKKNQNFILGYWLRVNLICEGLLFLLIQGKP